MNTNSTAFFACLAASPAAASDPAGPRWRRPLLDRPFLQRVVENVVARGARRVDFFLNADGPVARRLLGDGLRFGAEFHFHDHAPSERAGEHARDTAWREGYGACLAARVDALVLDDAPLTGAGAAGRVLAWEAPPLDAAAADAPRPGGPPANPSPPALAPWCWLPTECWEAAPRGAAFEELLEHCGLLARAAGETRAAAAVYWNRDWPDLLAAQRAALASRAAAAGGPARGAGAGPAEDAAPTRPALPLVGRDRAPGARVGRNVKIHRTARLEGPVFVGDHAWIGAGVALGPGVVVSENCVIDRGAELRDALVLANTYVGVDLRLVDCVVTGEAIHHARRGATLPIRDRSLACRL